MIALSWTYAQEELLKKEGLCDMKKNITISDQIPLFVFQRYCRVNFFVLSQHIYKIILF